ncbi:DUF6115 domain-containing protein [Hathewaya limosa]|uniref:Uncharacterized protein n=1 Tax=Hathewaya limosa TaxID=1536 RepID=A0ABU0JS57_HATLI|nr:hypothetical protein [Hathewaya limosa]MDQ0479275.1 hypothetical protein [Hathewaya limosa]
MIIFLLTIGIILIIYSVLGIKKEEKGFNNFLEGSFENAKDEKLEIGILRKEIAETLTEIQKDLVSMEDEIAELKVFKESLKNVKESNSSLNINFDCKKDDNIKSNENRKLEIKKLLEEGHSVEEISANFNIGKGEVLLIRDLYQK